MIPPSTSLGQWTPSITRDSAVNRIAAAAQPSATRRHGGGARSAKASATAVTLVAWPPGSDQLDTWSRCGIRPGRGRTEGFFRDGTGDGKGRGGEVGVDYGGGLNDNEKK